MNLGKGLIIVSGMSFSVFGLVLISTTYLGETLELGLTQIALTKTEIGMYNPMLLSYVQHIHLSVGLLMMALGVAVAGIGWFAADQKWGLAVAAGVLLFPSLVGAVIHIPYGLHSFTHLGPIYFTSVLVVVGVWRCWCRAT